MFLVELYYIKPISDRTIRNALIFALFENSVERTGDLYVHEIE